MTTRVIATLNCGCVLQEGGTRVWCVSCTNTIILRTQDLDAERIVGVPEEQPVQARIEELMNDAERNALQSLASGDFFEVARWDQAWAALNQVAAVQRRSPFEWVMELAQQRLDDARSRCFSEIWPVAPQRGRRCFQHCRRCKVSSEYRVSRLRTLALSEFSPSGPHPVRPQSQ